MALPGIVTKLQDLKLLVEHKNLPASVNWPKAFVSHHQRAGDQTGFVAVKGTKIDGHSFISSAVKAGAPLLVVEDPGTYHNLDHPALLVTDSRCAWAWLSAAAAGDPQEQLEILGVTGTNGKTSVVWLLRQLLELAGNPCTSIGTLGLISSGENPQMEANLHTSPDPDVLFPWLAKQLQEGVRCVAMEVSSIALEQQRLAPLRFSAIGFTSFSRDHLDYHGTMESYFAAKEHLWQQRRHPDSPGFVCTSVLEQAVAATSQWRSGQAYGSQHITLEGLDQDGRQIASFQFRDQKCSGSLPGIGQLAAENFLLALNLTATVVGHWPAPQTWQRLTSVPGRMEPLGAGVYVDYAHTPEAVATAIAAVKVVAKGQIWVIIGCGGDRDRGKRALMAKAAAAAHHVVLTSDNPRSEDPQAILMQMETGIPRGTSYQVIVDRAAAIRQTIVKASDEDTVLICGKGAETYQEINGQRIAFDDRLQGRKALEERHNAPRPRD